MSLPVTIALAGDSTLLATFGTRIAPEVNARAVSVGDAVRLAGVPGVRDVVVTFCSVAISFDPLTVDVGRLADLVRARAATSAAVPERRSPLIEIPVRYGGVDGPDLADVARFAGCSEAEVVHRHVSATYRVYMLGFMPGFGYMASVDDRIAMPRRATPRVRVPAGSVGIAGRQTGVYPSETPGGWQLIGRTTIPLFSLDRDPPTLLQPGSLVRFVPIQDAAPAAVDPSPDP